MRLMDEGQCRVAQAFPHDRRFLQVGEPDLLCPVSRARPAAALLEFALVGSLTFLLILGLMIGGLGIFYYNAVASIARDAARQASVHGAQYAKENPPNKAWTASDVYNNVISPQAQAAGLDLGGLSYLVTPPTMPGPYRMQTVNGQLVTVNNTVTVTISYQWVAPTYFGTINLRSTSVTPMTY